jgi:hypothetical protein
MEDIKAKVIAYRAKTGVVVVMDAPGRRALSAAPSRLGTFHK